MHVCQHAIPSIGIFATRLELHSKEPGFPKRMSWVHLSLQVGPLFIEYTSCRCCIINEAIHLPKSKITFLKKKQLTLLMEEILQPVDLGGSVLSHYLQALQALNGFDTSQVMISRISEPSILQYLNKPTASAGIFHPRCSFPEPSASNIRKADSETELGRSCGIPRHEPWHGENDG